MMNYGNQPGLEAILQALLLGGQPLGNLGQVPTGINPSAPSVSPLGSNGRTDPSQPSSPTETQGLPFNPARIATSPVQNPQISAILQALLQNGAGGFNLGSLPIG